MRLWYPRPATTELVKTNPEIAERIYQLLELGYKIGELISWFRLDQVASRAQTNTAKANQLWEDLKACYNYRCAYCGEKPGHLTKDHVLSVDHGGADRMYNIVPACQKCNSSKHNKDLLDWGRFHKVQLHLLGY